MTATPSEESDDVTMSDEDRAELARLQRAVLSAESEAEKAREARNSFMYRLYNGYLADVKEIASTIKMRRQNVHTIVRGPRTGTRRALSSQRWPRRGEKT